MPVSGSVSQSTDGTILQFMDTSTGITVTSRSLSVYDSNGVVVNTYNMGTNLTQNVPITKDVYYSFLLTLNGNQTGTVNYLSTRQYDLQALTIEQKISCNCATSNSLCTNATKALLAKSWAITYLLFGQGQNAQRNIDSANAYIAMAVNNNCNC